MKTHKSSHLRALYGDLVLDALPTDGSARSLADLAQATGLPGPTVARVIGQMPGSVEPIRRTGQPMSYRRAPSLISHA